MLVQNDPLKNVRTLNAARHQTLQIENKTLFRAIIRVITLKILRSKGLKYKCRKAKFIVEDISVEKKFDVIPTIFF